MVASLTHAMTQGPVNPRVKVLRGGGEMPMKGSMGRVQEGSFLVAMMGRMESMPSLSWRLAGILIESRCRCLSCR